MSNSTTRRKRGWAVAAAATSILTGLALVAPASAVANAAEPTRTARAAVQAVRGEVTWSGYRQWNGNGTSRCRQGQSYFKVSYSGDYKIFVRLRAGTIDDFTDYNEFRTSSYFNSGSLTSSRTGSEGYVNAPGQSVLGVGVYDRFTDQQLWWALWNYSVPCGYDLTVNFRDTD